MKSSSEEEEDEGVEAPSSSSEEDDLLIILLLKTEGALVLLSLPPPHLRNDDDEECDELATDEVRARADEVVVVIIGVTLSLSLCSKNLREKKDTENRKWITTFLGFQIEKSFCFILP